MNDEFDTTPIRCVMMDASDAEIVDIMGTIQEGLYDESKTFDALAAVADFLGIEYA